MQALLELFAEYLTTPAGSQAIYFQTTQPSNVPEQTGWMNSANREFRIFGTLSGETVPAWHLLAVVDGSVNTAALADGAVSFDKLASAVQARFASVDENIARNAAALEERIGGGSKAATFYIMADGSVAVVGLQVNGKLGIGHPTTGDNTALPKRCVFDPPLDSGERAVKIYTQLESSFVLTDAGHVYACGSNYQGQLGLSPTVSDGTHVWTFTRIDPANFSNKQVVELAIGSGGGPYISAYARTSDGYVYVWGHNAAGQLGRGNTTTLNVPTPVPGLESLPSRVAKIVAVGGGTSSTVNASAYALLTDGTVYAAGYNADGQLGQGLGNFTSLNVFTKITTLSDLAPVKVTDVTACGDLSKATAFFVMSDGTVFSCGNNRQGQCGQNLNPATLANQKLPLPAKVQLGAGSSDLGSGAAKVVKVVAFDGTSTVFAILEEPATGEDPIRSAVCWGYNADGVLGIGNTTNQYYAIATPFTEKVKDIAVGGNNGNPSAVVLLSDNKMWAAGNNSQGQLGVGNQTGTWTTWKRVLLSDADEIAEIAFAANNYPTSTNASVFQARLTNGRVLVCGYDSPGNGQTGVDSSPTVVTALQRVRF